MHRCLSTKSCKFVNIACKFIIVTLLIVTSEASIHHFLTEQLTFLYVSLIPISSVFTTHSINLNIHIKLFY